MPDILSRASGAVAAHRGLFLPLAAIGLILVIIIPLPAMVMDILLCANLAISAVILLTALQVSTPLEFSAFPTLLLLATLWRLVLNVASTRLILTAGRNGLQDAQLGAGHVINAFGGFVPSGSLAVGLILFGIIVLVQFMVITKGASRISEVAARFTLDAMPGRQMAIDAELASGRIEAAQASRQRAEIARSADFYGAMDGASKFLRGDALAGLVITVVNLLGGMYVGMVEYGWSWSDTSAVFSRLTVGDGLVTQIPAFLLSISAALLVSRSGRSEDLGRQVISQLAARPVVLAIAAGFLGMLLFTQLPKLPLLMLGGGLAGLAYTVRGRARNRAASKPASCAAIERHESQDAVKMPAVDPVRLDLGFALVRLADKARGGDLTDRIAQMRMTIAEELGLMLGPIRIRDDMRLESHEYAIFIRGAKIASGRLYPNQRLAVGGDLKEGDLHGRATTEPVFGTPAVWISPSQSEKAIALKCMLVEPAAVLIAHLGDILRSHAPQLLARKQVADMLETLKVSAPGLVQEITQRLSVGDVQKVLGNLLSERVSIRDLEMILEAAGDAVADGVQGHEAITERVRSSLGRALCQQYASADGRLWCVSLDASLEDSLCRYVGHGKSGAIPPEVNRKVARTVASRLEDLRRSGRQAVVLCSPPLRPAIRRMLADISPKSTVLAYNEVNSVEVNSVATVGADES